jgi:putative aldouronate transport system substrate-binding protein
MDLKKKIIIALCIVCILIAALFYLKNNHDDVKISTKNTEEIIIKYMVLGERYKDSDSIFLEFNRHLKKYFPNTTVEFEVVPKENYKEKWDMKMATNDTLDLAWIGNDIFNYTEEVKKGSFTALDYLIETYGTDLKEVIPKKMWELQKNEGNTYSIPVPGILYRKSYAVVANKELMDRYGDIEKIGTINRSKQYTDKECYNSFEEFLQKAKENGAVGAGISYKTFSQIADKGYEGIYGSDSPFVIKIFDEKLTVYDKYETESWKLCFKTMDDWYKKGYIRKDIMDILNPLKGDGKLNGSVLFIDDYGQHSEVSSMVQTEYKAATEPLVDYKYISYGACRNSIVIPKSTEHPQRAMEIANFLMSDEGIELSRLLANGIKDNDNEISKSELKQINQYNQNALVSNLSGFELDTRMIILEMSKVDLVVDEYKERLIQGTTDDWDKVYEEFIIKMKKAGSDNVIQEMQKQIDKFAKKSTAK